MSEATPTPRRLAALAASCACFAGAAGAQVSVWLDPPGDAVIRRTDTGANGLISPDAVIPDLLRAVLGGWEPFNPVSDPYSGTYVDGDDAHLLRLDVVFAGVVCPPGPLGITTPDYDPMRFGPSPIFGFLDLDIDDQKNSGGELGSAAEQRYLANVGRFGMVPQGSFGERAALSAFDYDGNFFSGPQYERTGADFALLLCGCTDVTVVSEGGDLDGCFEAGETWIVRGRFFERARGFREASSAFGGSASQLYDPVVHVRFSHDPVPDETSITLVYALDMEGAAMLTGQPVQPLDFNVLNHTSIVEGLQDVIDGIDTKPLTPEANELLKPWKGRDPYDYLDPTRWGVTALFGMPYVLPEDALYAWTDTGFGETPADVNTDGVADALDGQAIRDEVYALDGGVRDADGVKNGRVVIVNVGRNFSVYDVDGNGLIEFADLYAYGNPADFNGDGVLNIFDFLAFQGAISQGDMRADFNLDGVLNIFDFLAFQAAFFH